MSPNTRQDAAANDIPAHYYHDNFLRLCSSVEDQYSDLLSASELRFIANYRQLSFDAQCLYVRLVSRTGPWFRESRLSYPELGCETQAINELIDGGYGLQTTDLSLEELGTLFTVAELRDTFASNLDCAPASTKGELLASIAGLDLAPREYMTALSARCEERIIAPAHVDSVNLFQLLFFGNRYQSLTDFLLQDLGVVKYYPYSMDRAQRLFTSRDAIEEYLLLAALSDLHAELIENDERDKLPHLAEQVLQINPGCTSSTKRWNKLCNRLSRDLERSDHLELASALYTRSSDHPARERQARIAEQQGRLEYARQLCEQIDRDPWCEAERDAARRILPRLQRKLKGEVQRRSNSKLAEVEMHLHSGDKSVELLVADALQQYWHEVHYVENTLMNGLFALAFWEEIFAPVPGAFTHPYQSIPLDMYDRAFYRRREELLNKRLSALAQADLQQLLTAAYARYQHYQCRWVNWRYLSADLVETAARVIPGEDLMAIWERLLFDPGENRKGLPDLIAFGEAPGDYAMIEVKGPGDKLQDGQKRWLTFFQQQGIPAHVAWVHWNDE